MVEMKQFSDVIEINEAMLNPDMLTFIPCQATKGEVKYCVAVGNIFNIKKNKYCQTVEENLRQLGLNIKTGYDAAAKVIKQASTKLIYIIYNSNMVMICNSDILKPLDGQKLK